MGSYDYVIGAKSAIKKNTNAIIRLRETNKKLAEIKVLIRENNNIPMTLEIEEMLSNKMRYINNKIREIEDINGIINNANFKLNANRKKEGN